MLTGSLVTAAGFVPVGFARSSAGEYTFSIFAVVAYALLPSWFVAVIFAPLLGVIILSKPKAKPADKPSRILRYFRGFLVGAMRARWVTIGVTLAGFAAAISGKPLGGAPVLSAIRSSGPSGRPLIAAKCLDLCQ
jgi:multidrug efflux pump